MTRLRLFTGLLLCFSICSNGCHDSPWPKKRPMSPQAAAALAEIATQQQQLEEATLGAFQGETWPLGAIPWNGSILPLLSPDGKWVATSCGEPPSHASRMALPDATRPSGSEIQIWEVLPGWGGLRRTSTLTDELILTDAADAEGFLVESPRQNGARWIGKVDWRTGETRWLVRDDMVNAMPSIGARGRLAWCTRSRETRLFSLAIRMPDAREFAIPANDGDWLLPAWSTRSDRLSVWRFDESGVLSLVSIDASTDEQLAMPAAQINVLNGATKWDAFTATSNRAVRMGLPPTPVEEVMFYHPVYQCIAVWMPTGINSDRLVMLAPGSIDAIHDDAGHFLVTMPRGLHWQDLGDLRRIVRVNNAAVFARSTTDPMRPFVLLDPGGEVVRLQGMRPMADSIEASSSASGM